MNRIILLFIVFSALGSNGCDVIREDNRVIDMEEVIPMKKVLLIDFTDQACPNCPKAGKEVEKLKESYGEDIVAVTVHASSRNLPLVTKDGNTYDMYFGTRQAGHPAGVIDGKLDVNFLGWADKVLNRFNVPSSVDIALTTEYNLETGELTIHTDLKGLLPLSNAKLLLWITENDIIDRQLVDNTTVPDYKHHYIFRAAVNSTWGEELSLPPNEEKTMSHTYVLNEKWNVDKISVVCFVYNSISDDVFDVTEVEINTPNKKNKI